MIRNIVFDMGNVLIEWNPGKILERYAISEEEKRLLMRELFHEEEWVMLDEDTITYEDAIAAIAARTGQQLEPVIRDIITGWWKFPFDPIEGMDPLIKELRREGYRLYLLSNASLAQTEYYPRIPGGMLFDGRITSAEVRLIKPDPRIFQCFLKKYHLQAEECLFIDDSAANVHAAKLLGFEGYVFHNDVSLLRKQLQDAGILK